MYFKHQNFCNLEIQMETCFSSSIAGKSDVYWTSQQNIQFLSVKCIKWLHGEAWTNRFP